MFPNNLKSAALLLCLTFAACGGGDASTNSSAGEQAQQIAAAPQSIEEMITSIKADEDLMYKKGEKFVFNKKNAAVLVGKYERFAKQYPQDKRTPEYLFKAAEIHRSLKQFAQSNKCYQTIIKKYAEYEKAPQSLFLLGFTYENDLRDSDKAKALYEQFLQKYPKHELSDDVEFSLSNIGISPEDIIKQFEKNKKK